MATKIVLLDENDDFHINFNVYKEIDIDRDILKTFKIKHHINNDVSIKIKWVYYIIPFYSFCMLFLIYLYYLYKKTKPSI